LFDNPSLIECWRIYLRACINLENALMEAGMLSRYTRNLTKLLPALGLIAAATSPLAVVEYKLPRDGAFPHDPAVGGDGIVWYTDQQNSFIGRLDPATGKIEEYALPAAARDPHTPLIRKGIVWFTVQQSNVYGRFDPRTHEAKVWTVPTSRALPYGMVNAPDGSIWVALFGTNKLGRIDAESGALREINLPQSGARPRRLVVDESGVVWYSDFARGYLGSYNPKTGAFKEWLSPGGASSAPYGIAIAPDGRIFYDEARPGTIVAFDRKSGQAETIKIPTPGSTVRNISVDSTRSRIWLALSGTSRIGKIELK
jgi:virginiamycin B lyase